jgi:2-polyprenyl-3-methyl-5-hydroxy-6-metoxy-1,4-benzoquinol methylase
MNYYDNKENEYYNQVRKDILPYIPVIKTAKFLDIGCSGGNVLCYLKETKIIEEAVGVDLMKIPQSNQQNLLLDKFILADVQQQQLNLPEQYFDIMLCADVLEHLQDPWATLEYLKKFMKKDGLLIISIPNIREFRALRKIFLKGDFLYAPSGILDKTHLRFFCKKNIIELVSGAGFLIEKTAPTFKTCPSQKRRNLFSKITLGIFDQFLAQQYIVTARKV